MSGLGLTLRGLLLPHLGRYSSQRAAAPVLHVARGVPFTSYWATADRFTTGLLTSSTRAMSGKIDLYSPSTSWKEAKTFLKGLNNKQRREHYSVKDFIKLKEIPAWKDTAKKAQAKQPEEVKFPKSKDLNEKISLVRGDITKLEVDAIVNAGVNCLTYDEAIIAQQDRIQQEIAGHTPLLSDRLDLSVLYQEYAPDDQIYQDKIKDLHRRYTYIRRTRPDGNCFYRAFGYSYLEALLDGGSELERFKEVAMHSKEELIRQGFTEFTIEDFHNTFMDLIALVEKRPTVSELLAAFNEQTVSDYVVVYLRLLTSGHLQRETVFYQHFIEGGRSVKEFCQQEVEPMCKESDHIHIIALSQALNVSIQVEYMDRGEGGSTVTHVFPEGSNPQVFLLYRPGHYDILYK